MFYKITINFIKIIKIIKNFLKKDDKKIEFVQKCTNYRTI
jgi:hypothetical protein